MSGAHRDPLYARNARIVRASVNAAHKRGESVACIGCGREVQPGQRFDVGHIIDASRGGSNALDNLGAQHRRENRSAGGRLGAHAVNTQRGTSRKARGLPTW